MSAPEIELPDAEEVRDRFSRRVAILIVVGTLIGAMVGYLQTTAGRRSNEAGVAAQRHATRAMGALLRSQQIAQVDFENYALADQQARRAAASRQQYFFLSGDDEREAQLAQRRYERLAERSSELTGITPEREDGPVLDPGFPSEFFANARRDAVVARALQDAANEEDGAWGAKESTYTAILTVLAVALYLLGLSLTVKIGVRRLFAGLGAGLIAVGALWAAVVAIGSPPRPSPEAAEAFADGHVALEAAATRPEFEEAIRHYDRAIELRPTFALAYQERSEAIFAAGAPPGQGLRSVSTPEALAASTRDLERALELGLENRIVLANLGFHLFLQGLELDSDDHLERSVQMTDRAIAFDPDDPVPWFNRGVALLALGREEEARANYDRAIRLVIYTDVEEETLRDDPGTEQLYLSGALTDLEIVAAGRPDLAGTVAEVKERLVTAVSLHRLEPGDAPETIPAITIDVFPAELQWSAEIPGHDADADTVSTQWYYRDERGLGWAAMPNVSGVRAPTPSTAGGYFDLTSYLASTFPPSCLASGTYRAEIYVNGRLAGTAESEKDVPDFEAYVPRDLNAAMCRPTDWERSERSITGWFDGFVGPDEDRGVYVFRYTPPRGEAGFDLLDGTIEIFGDLFPGDGAPVFDADEGTDTDYFMGLDDPRKRWYDYPGGYVRAGSGRADDGTIIVAVVFGPVDFMSTQGDAGLAIFDSLIEFEPVG